MVHLIAEELSTIPELPSKVAKFGVSRHPAFANVPSAVQAASSGDGPFYSCSILE